ncbi:hypothetical protein [Pseudoflavonifractor phocaeensis]|uniref:hypothetical protein n=1 Tax=Pseudoflavonifractor phocaeensis TaxID=1870988 RepID=UPI0019560D59|nr:hypothetical protein [Pseudoflavonifractor phocaeensis]MBM6870417.1 hypothetical protein [Pseudoflavonifractor phocaeensis]
MNCAAVQTVLRRCGQTVTLRRTDGTEETAVAIVQPILRQDDRQNLPQPQGLEREDAFLYLGPPDKPLEGGARVRCREQDYEVCQAQPIYIASTLSHWWAVLRPEAAV